MSPPEKSEVMAPDGLTPELNRLFEASAAAFRRAHDAAFGSTRAMVSRSPRREAAIERLIALTERVNRLLLTKLDAYPPSTPVVEARARATSMLSASASLRERVLKATAAVAVAEEEPRTDSCGLSTPAGGCCPSPDPPARSSSQRHNHTQSDPIRLQQSDPPTCSSDRTHDLVSALSRPNNAREAVPASITSEAGSSAHAQTEAERRVAQLLRMANMLFAHVDTEASHALRDGKKPTEGKELLPRRDVLTSQLPLIESSERIFSVVEARLLAEVEVDTSSHGHKPAAAALSRTRTILHMVSGLQREIERALVKLQEPTDDGKKRSEGFEKPQVRASDGLRIPALGDSSTARASDRSDATTGSNATASSKRRTSTASSTPAEILAYIRALELDPATVKALERALRPGRRQSLVSGGTGRSGISSTLPGSASGRSAGSNEGGAEQTRATCCWLMSAVQSSARCVLRVQPMLQLLCIYSMAALLAPLSVFVPSSYLLNLDNEDDWRWIRYAWEAALLDAVVLQPMLQVFYMVVQIFQ